ncbi:hypothetical protein MAPG_02753 [Magnaporthiopsis poae ATCC 64411]|uniref:Uncharacterized protein n=1 Tax=Magnaporthiopsis poae (strain ATCC 64411 / 73-15) TaxID=644358 RepID=A0A0C4DS76_MAGP6|nr:hypothetical protein MAPG_02753 [Magnaporthiopsis poae ATCC 64411]
MDSHDGVKRLKVSLHGVLVADRVIGPKTPALAQPQQPQQQPMAMLASQPARGGKGAWAPGNPPSLPPKPVRAMSPLVRAKKLDGSGNPAKDVAKRPPSDHSSMAAKRPGPSHAPGPAAKYRKISPAGSDRGVPVAAQQRRGEGVPSFGLKPNGMVPGASKKAHPIPKAGAGTGTSLGRTPESILAFKAAGSGIPRDTEPRSTIAYTGNRAAESKQVLVSKGDKATKGRRDPKQVLVKKSDEAIKDRAVQQERVTSTSPASYIKQEFAEDAGEAIKDRPVQQKRVVAKSPAATAPASRPGKGPARVPYTGPVVASASAGNQSSRLLQTLPRRKLKKKIIRYTGTDALLGRRFRYVSYGPGVTAADIVQPTFFHDASRAISEANRNDHEQRHEDDASDETLAGLAETAKQNTLLYANLDDPSAFAHPVPQPLITLTNPLGDFSVLDAGLYAFGGSAAGLADTGNELLPLGNLADVNGPRPDDGFFDPYERYLEYRALQEMTHLYDFPWMKSS